MADHEWFYMDDENIEYTESLTKAQMPKPIRRGG